MPWNSRAAGLVPPVAIDVHAPDARSSAQVSFRGVKDRPSVLVLPPKTTRRLLAGSTMAPLFARPLGAVPVVWIWDQALVAKSKAQTSAYVWNVSPPVLKRPPKRIARFFAGSSAITCRPRAL